MPVRHLPLYRPAAVPGEVWNRPARALPSRALSVVDPRDGAASLVFAARLSAALQRRGRKSEVAIASFESTPAVEPSERALFAKGQELHALSANVSEAALAKLFGQAPLALWIVVGRAAWAFLPALAIMVHADTPRWLWPGGMREAYARVSLALSGDGSQVAEALAEGLATR